MVTDAERQPQHQFVQEQHDRVVAERLRVLGDRGQALVQPDVGGLADIGAEVVLL